jgi:hypothetical protein
MTNDRLVRLVTLYERTSRKGTRSFSGYLGDMLIVMFADKPADDGTPRWNLFVQERDPSRRPPRQVRPRPGDERDERIPF